MAENNIIIKITSEADLTQAQQQIKDLTDESQRLTEQMEDLKRQEKEDEASIKSLNLSRAQEAKRLKENAAYYRGEREAIKGEIKERKQAITELGKQVNAYKTLNGITGKAAQQLRAMREELMRMEDAGEYGTEAFINLSIKASELEDQMGDLQQRIRILASDTKNMDAVLGLGDGLAGSFYIATSAAEVFGEDIEGLQKAFYKVQAAMSILSGVQQVYNSLQKDSAFRVVFNTAVEKLAAKSKDTQTASLKKNTKAWFVNGAASTSASIKLAAQTAVTKVATIAQAALNAVIYANPFVLLAAAIGVAAAAIVGFVAWNDKGAKAARAFNEANRQLEMDEAKAAVGQEERNFKRQQQIKKTNDAEEKALADAKARHASELEMAGIRTKYAKQRSDETKKYADEEIKRNEVLKADAYNAMEAKRKEAESYRNNTKKKKKALEELAEAEAKYYGYAQKIEDYENEKKDAEKAVTDAQREAAEARQQLALEAEQANIDLMRAGATKEIAQINLNFREKLKNVKGNSKEEKALRKALEEQQAREIQAVRDKYAEQARQTEIQNRKNLLTLMSQTKGDEESYQEQIALEKKILKLEAADQIKALQDSVKRKEMSEKEATAKITAIRLQLQKDLNAIDEQDYQRTAENAKRRTAIFVKEAENETNLLNGSEPIAEQLEVWDHYYAQRKTQIEQNAQFEKEAAQRAFARGEMSAEQLADREREIQANLNSDIENLRKEGASKVIEVNDQYLSDLELAVSKAEDKLSKAGGNGTQLQSLRELYDAQLDLYDGQMASLQEKYNAGLISYQDYKNQEFEILKATTDAEVAYRQQAMQAVLDGMTTALGYMQQASDLVFEALSSSVQAELDELEEMYTTDWEEAQKDANKKYMTEKEYEKKKAELQKRQQRYAKAQAIVNAAIQTAMAIVTTLGQLGATPWGIAAAALAGFMGAAQIAVIASKPLSQYAKGRKGGEGEYALVGEKGPEIMYIPKGASIIPNHKMAKPEDWGEFGVPQMDIPLMPFVNPETSQFITSVSGERFIFDYTKAGEEFAKHLPKQQAVSVHVDRSGVHVNDGYGVHTHLNAKYTGSWQQS